MAHIIPATVIVDRDGDKPPKLVMAEGGSDLGELIAERGIEIEQDSCECFPDKTNPVDQLESPNLPEPEPADRPPANGFRACMSEHLLRSPESEPLTQPENQQRFKQAAILCKSRRQEEAAQQQD